MTAPPPGDSFEWRRFGDRDALVCQPLEPYAAHLFTTSAWPLGSRDASVGGDDGWRDVSRALAVDEARLVRARQVHGADILVGTESMAGGSPVAADIVLVHEPVAAAAVQVADCVAMLAVDRITGAVAAVHAGWRGIVQRVPRVAVDAMRQRFGTRPGNVLVALGPSIGSCCYEVGPDVRARFVSEGFTASQIRRWFKDRPDHRPGNAPLPRVRDADVRQDRWFFDGWAATREQIVMAGVPAVQVFSAELCTASHPAVFCSYRRDGAPAGRMVGAIRCETRP